MMKKKLISAAVLVGIAGSAGAVNVNPDGLGQALLYSYYTVRGGNDTLVSITNTTDQVKAVKVRFLEAKNTREVLDFNLYLSPSDMWTGAIVQTENGAKLTSSDTSCTVPAIPADGVEFRNFAYSGANADGEDESLNRTREGHMNVLEMGVVGFDGSFTPDTWATHVAGIPDDCDSIRAAWAPGGAWATNALRAVGPASGGLYGGAYIISVANGTDISYNATALDGWRQGTAAIHTDPGSLLPNLNNTFPEVSNVFHNGGVVTTDWGFGANAGVNAVSAVLMHDTIMNDYTVEAGLDAGTDWVITFPTKNFYVNEIVTALPPFTEVFGEGGAPERIALKLWDREEKTTIGDVDFSPLPPGGFNSLPWETNVLTINDSNVLGSEVSENVPTDFDNGWMRVSFVNVANVLTAPDGTSYFGLPTTGFSVMNLKNGDVGGVLSNYGNLFEHRATRNIVPGSVE